MGLEALAYARKIVDVASDKQASDIVLLDLRDLKVFADFFVIMTIDNSRLLNALQQDVVEAVEKAGGALYHQEGTVDAGWVLLDFGDVVVHLFAPEERAYYQLEELWAKGQEMVRVL